MTENKTIDEIIREEDFVKNMQKWQIKRAYTVPLIDEEYYKNLNVDKNKLLDKTLMRLAVNRALNKLNKESK